MGSGYYMPGLLDTLSYKALFVCPSPKLRARCLSSMKWLRQSYCNLLFSSLILYAWMKQEHKSKIVRFPNIFGLTQVQNSRYITNLEEGSIYIYIYIYSLADF